MAQLLQAVDTQRSSALHATAAAGAAAEGRDGAAAAAPPPPGALTALSRVNQLLSAAAANLSKLTADDTQLFPSDMGDVLKAYRCVVQQHGRRCKAAACTLNARVRSILEASGTSLTTMCCCWRCAAVLHRGTLPQQPQRPGRACALATTVRAGNSQGPAAAAAAAGRAGGWRQQLRGRWQQ